MLMIRKQPPLVKFLDLTDALWYHPPQEVLRMKWFAPEIYPAFRCIGGRCQHSCCVGWQVCIDPQSAKRYRGEASPFGQRLRDGMVWNQDGPSFRMDEQGRCCFLNQDGLCDLILQLGPDSLCQICQDHPRFRNHWAGRTELGLGLCCEEAARLWLTHPKPMKLILLEDDGQPDDADARESAFLAQRAYLFAILQRRNIPMELRLRRILTVSGTVLAPASAWDSRLSQLERLDAAWTESLALLPFADGAPLPATPEWKRAWEQLTCYFLYRHLSGKDFRRGVAFAVQSTLLIRRLCQGQKARRGTVSFQQLLAFARQYSSEVEYSQENLTAMMKHA